MDITENDNNIQGLLNKDSGNAYYDDNCPGCQIDLYKRNNPGIPFKFLFYVWIVVLAAALPISSLFPFLYFKIRDFHVAKREEDIGYYAGYVGSAFMFGRALTSVLWGVIADRYGRKCVIIFGVVTLLVVLIICFIRLFSTHFSGSVQAFGRQFLQGFS